MGNGYLEFNITLRENDTTNFHREGPIRLVNNGYDCCFEEARLITTIGSDIEHNNFCGHVSTFMKVISNKDDDLLSRFVNINENDIPLLERLADLAPQIRSTPHQNLLTILMWIKVKLKDIHIWKIFLDFAKVFKKVTKKFGFHLMFKTANLHGIIYTSMEDDINMKNSSLYLYIPNLIPSVETQL